MGDLDAAALLGASLIVFLLNLVPALMPPTWVVLALLHVAFGVPALPLAIAGAFSASAGRLTLALAARRYGRGLLSPVRRAELAGLGRWLDAKARWAAPLAVRVCSFGPIPSNQLFIAAGLTRMQLARIVAAFCAGRLVSYPLWIAASRVTAARLQQLLLGQYMNVAAITLEVGLVVLLIAFVRVDWLRVIGRFDPAFAAPSLAR